MYKNNISKKIIIFIILENISKGVTVSHVILKTGELFMFGRGRDGQLGRGDVIESIAAYRTSPLRVEYFVKNEIKVDKLALGSNHSVALVSIKQ